MDKPFRCVACGFPGEKQQLLKHVFRQHVHPSRAPYFCQLCGYKAVSEQEWKKHLKTFKNHRDKVKALRYKGLNVPDEFYLIINRIEFVLVEGRDIVRRRGSKREYNTQWEEQDTPETKDFKQELKEDHDTNTVLKEEAGNQDDNHSVNEQVRTEKAESEGRETEVESDDKDCNNQRQEEINVVDEEENREIEIELTVDEEELRELLY